MREVAAKATELRLAQAAEVCRKLRGCTVGGGPGVQVHAGRGQQRGIGRLYDVALGVAM